MIAIRTAGVVMIRKLGLRLENLKIKVPNDSKFLSLDSENLIESRFQIIHQWINDDWQNKI